MTSERIAYLNGRRAAMAGTVTHQEAAVNANMSGMRGLFYMGALDQFNGDHLELAEDQDKQ